jgi:hypothetical protein
VVVDYNIYVVVKYNNLLCAAAEDNRYFCASPFNKSYFSQLVWDQKSASFARKKASQRSVDLM